MLKRIGVAVILAIAAILILAFTKPSTFRVQRSVTINASPQKVASLINDFHQWDAWSPWIRLDPDMKTVYSGPPSGVGSICDWTGNRKVGRGRMEIVSVDPARTSIKLDVFEPVEAHNAAEFALESQGTSTHVDWIMNGPVPFFPGRIASVFTSMDKILGPNFEIGLANMKAAAERQ
jgi:hypothetical protein